MANLKQAILWMFEGKKVASDTIDDNMFLRWDDDEGFIDSDGDNYMFCDCDCEAEWSIHVQSTLEDKEAEISNLRSEVASLRMLLGQQGLTTLHRSFPNG